MYTIKPSNDLFFRKMFTEKGSEPILENFVQAVTGMTLTNIRPGNPYQFDRYKADIANITRNDMYQTIVDVAATTAEGLDIIIEMQLYPHRGFFERVLYYWAQAYVKNYDTTSWRLSPVISIVVTDFDVFQTDSAALVPVGLTNLDTHTELYNNKHQPYERFYFVSLIDRYTSQNPVLEAWRQFLKYGIITETAPDAIKNAGRLLTKMTMNTEEFEMAQQMEKYEEVYWKQIDFAKNEGIEVGLERGIERGIEQERKETIKKLARSMSPEQIADALHYSLSYVRMILQQ